MSCAYNDLEINAIMAELEGDLEKSKRLFDQLIDEYPEEGSAIIRRVNLLYKGSEEISSEDQLREIIGMLDKAEQLITTGQSKHSMDKYDGLRDLYFLRGFYYHVWAGAELKYAERARKEFDRALKLDPDYKQAQSMKEKSCEEQFAKSTADKPSDAKYESVTFEEYQSMVADAGKMLGQNKFDEAISLCKKVLEVEACDEEPYARIWPAGTIVMAYVFKHENNEPDPGSYAYDDLKKYTIVTLDAFDELDPEQQEHYKDSHQLFHILRPIREITQAGKPLSELQVSPQKTAQKKSGCFVATAIYGSYNDDNVVILRKYRDKVLLTKPCGRAFVSFYYWVSPPLAKILKNIPLLRSLLRKLVIQPIVDHLSSSNH